MTTRGGKQLFSGIEALTEYVIPEPNTGCWLWIGPLVGEGYGSLWARGRQHRAHRFAYEHYVGPIPHGLTIDHLCRVRCCVNPLHLEPVTMRENTMRGFGPTAQNHRKTTCAKGHELVSHRSRPGYRCCYVCDREINLTRTLETQKAWNPERRAVVNERRRLWGVANASRVNARRRALWAKKKKAEKGDR